MTITKRKRVKREQWEPETVFGFSPSDALKIQFTTTPVLKGSVHGSEPGSHHPREGLPALVENGEGETMTTTDDELLADAAEHANLLLMRGNDHSFRVIDGLMRALRSRIENERRTQPAGAWVMMIPWERTVLWQFAYAVESLTLEMPASNSYTPRFVELCEAMRKAVLQRTAAPTTDPNTKSEVRRLREAQGTPLSDFLRQIPGKDLVDWDKNFCDRYDDVVARVQLLEQKA